MNLPDIKKQLEELNVKKEDILEPVGVDYEIYLKEYTDKLKYDYDKSKNELKEVFDMLEDQRSKDTLNGVISFIESLNFDYIKNIYDSRYPQYFDKEIIKLTDNEVFVDGGAYDFESSLEFIEQTGGKFKKIYAFEPDEKNYEIMKINISEEINNDKNIVLINKGIYSKKGPLYFTQNGTSSKINNEGEIKIEVDSLDNLVEEPTYIKFDIEGSEIEGLKGAEKIIRKYKPKLAICAYHEVSHLWEVPVLIKQFNPEYKIYFRHYSRNIAETVCYAI